MGIEERGAWTVMDGLAFLDAMEIVGRGPEWAALAAGYVLLTVAEVVLDGYDVTQCAIAEAKHAILMAPITCQRPLREIMEALQARDNGLAARRLIAYADQLHHAGYLDVAADVFAVVHRHVGEDFHDLRLQAMQGHAYALRLNARFDDAELVYEQMIVVARASRKRQMLLAARLGLGYVAMGRGNYPAAAALVDRVLHVARRPEDRVAREKALIARAGIAGTQRNHAAAAKYTAQALTTLVPSRTRDICLVNLGWSLRETKKQTEAIDAAWEAYQRSGDSETRYAAGILLYQISIDRFAEEKQSEEWSNRWRATLRGKLLSPTQRAELHFTEAVHDAEAGRWDDAATAIAAMLAVAESFKINEMLYKAAIAAEEVQRKEVPARYEWRPVRPERPKLKSLSQIGDGLQTVVANAVGCDVPGAAIVSDLGAIHV